MTNIELKLVKDSKKSHRKPNYLPEETKDGGDSSNSELSPNCNLFTTCKRNTTKGC